MESFDRRGISAAQRQVRNISELFKGRPKPQIKTPELPPGHKPLPKGLIVDRWSPGAYKVPDLDFLTGGKGQITPRIDAPRKTVSIHKELLGIGREFVLGRARAAATPRTVAQPGVSQASMIALPGPVIAAGGRLAGRAGSFATGLFRQATAFATGAAAASFFARNADGSCPVGTHPIKQDGVRGPKGSYCVRNRRMNVGNARAARRSVRRLKGARKLLRDIERMMPTKTTRRRAPRGHSEHLHHTGG